MKKKKKRKKKQKKSKTGAKGATIPRNPYALLARMRPGGPMKDRRAEQEGDRNVQKDLLDRDEESG